MIANASVGIVTPRKIPFDTSLALENGKTLPRFDLMTEACGTLNTDKSDVILICHALSGNHHIADKHSAEDKCTGWWDNMAGPGKPIGTERFFVVGLNNLGDYDGNTDPLSENPETGREYGTDFPIVTVKDWVKPQTVLADYLGVQRWAAVVGGSLGGMQALQWTISLPGRVAHALVIASTSKLPTRNTMFNDVARQAILTNSNFHGGNYHSHHTAPSRDLRIARTMGHITYLAEDGLGKRFGRILKSDGYQHGYGAEFEVKSYLRYQGDKFVGRFDANTCLLMTKVLSYFDSAADYGHSLMHAVENVQTRSFVASFSTDQRSSPQRLHELVKASIAVQEFMQYIEAESSHSHNAFLMEDEAYIRAVIAHMNNVYKDCQ